MSIQKLFPTVPSTTEQELEDYPSISTYLEDEDEDEDDTVFSKELFQPRLDFFLQLTPDQIVNVTIDHEWEDDHETCLALSVQLSNNEVLQVAMMWVGDKMVRLINTFTKYPKRKQVLVDYIIGDAEWFKR